MVTLSLHCHWRWVDHKESIHLHMDLYIEFKGVLIQIIHLWMRRKAFIHIEGYLFFLIDLSFSFSFSDSLCRIGDCIWLCMDLYLLFEGPTDFLVSSGKVIMAGAFLGTLLFRFFLSLCLCFLVSFSHVIFFRWVHPL
jgi:hypothetical protein